MSFLDGEGLEYYHSKLAGNPLYVHMVKGTYSASANNIFGDCIVIHGSKNGLIDFGADPNVISLKQYLQAQNITKLDFCIISHYHSDHITSDFTTALTALINAGIDFSECIFYLPHRGINWSQGNFETNLPTAASNVKLALNNANISYVEPTNKQIVTISKNLKIKFLNTDPNYYNDYYSYYVDEAGVISSHTIYNNFSMIAILEYFEKRLVFSGDIHFPAQKNNYADLNRADVYKVEHHGLNKATYQYWLDAINPEFALIGNYSNNHSDTSLTKMTVSNLINKGCTILSTADDDITLKVNRESIVKTVGVPYKTKNLFNSALFYEGEPLIKEHFDDSVKTDGLIDIDKLKTPGVYYVQNATLAGNNIYPKTINGASIHNSALKLINIQSTNNSLSTIQIYTQPFHNEWIAIRKFDDGINAWRDWFILGDDRTFSDITDFTTPQINNNRVNHVEGGYKVVGQKVYVHWEVDTNSFTFGAGYYGVSTFPTPKYDTPLIISAKTGDANVSKIVSSMVLTNGIFYISTSAALNGSISTRIVIHGEYIKA